MQLSREWQFEPGPVFFSPQNPVGFPVTLDAPKRIDLVGSRGGESAISSKM